MPKIVAIANSQTGIKSEPPSGMKKIKNVWWNSVTGEFVFDVED
jgi:hypothetical protein